MSNITADEFIDLVKSTLTEEDDLDISLPGMLDELCWQGDEHRMILFPEKSTKTWAQLNNGAIIVLEDGVLYGEEGGPRDIEVVASYDTGDGEPQFFATFGGIYDSWDGTNWDYAETYEVKPEKHMVVKYSYPVKKK